MSVAKEQLVVRDVPRRCVASYLVSVFFSIGSFVFVCVPFRYVIGSLDPALTDAQLSRQASAFVIYDQLLALVLAPCFGLLSERVGRVAVYTAGLASLALCIGAFPLATSIVPAGAGELWTSLLFLRLLFGVGAAACGVMIYAVLADYATARGRGPLAAALGLTAGFAALVSATCVPQLRRFSVAAMCRVVAVCVLVAAVQQAVLMRGARGQSRSPFGIAKSLATGFSAMREGNVLLSYLVSLLASGSSIVLSIYFDALGVRHLRSVAYSVLLAALIALGAASRRAKPRAVAGVSCFAGAIAYGVLGALPAAGSSAAFLAVAPLASAAYAGLLVSGSALLGSTSAAQSAEANRGMLSATFQSFGSLGILLFSLLGRFLLARRRGASLALLCAGLVHSAVSVFALLSRPKK